MCYANVPWTLLAPPHPTSPKNSARSWYDSMTNVPYQPPYATVAIPQLLWKLQPDGQAGLGLEFPQFVEEKWWAFSKFLLVLNAGNFREWSQSSLVMSSSQQPPATHPFPTFCTSKSLKFPPIPVETFGDQWARTATPTAIWTVRWPGSEPRHRRIDMAIT